MGLGDDPIAFANQYIAPDARGWFMDAYNSAEHPQAAGGQTQGAPSQADLEFTAKKYGMTVDQVKQRLGIH
jgi:hypothetical protein